MKKILVAVAMTLLAGCATVQLNVASNVNNVVIQKGQVTESGTNTMSGSQLEDVVKDSTQKNEPDIKVPVTPAP